MPATPEAQLAAPTETAAEKGVIEVSDAEMEGPGPAVGRSSGGKRRSTTVTEQMPLGAPFELTRATMAHTAAPNICANCAKGSDELYSCFVADLLDALPGSANVLESENLPHRRQDALPTLPELGSSRNIAVAGAAAIERLPFDVLAEILLSIPFSSTERRAIRAISRKFRDTVQDLLSFWKKIKIRRPQDLEHLDAMLLWSDPAPLEIKVDDILSWTHSTSHPDIFDADLTACLLAPQSSRIKSLELYLPDTFAMTPLLASNLQFDELENLVIRCFSLSIFALLAPRLKRLDLSGAAPQAWHSVVSSNLEKLRLFNIPPERFTQQCISEMLGLCPTLEDLDLNFTAMMDAVETWALQPRLWPRLAPLTRLHIVLPPPQLNAALRTFLIADTRTIFAETEAGTPTTTAPFADAIISLLAGAERFDFDGPVVHFVSASFARYFGLRDGSLSSPETAPGVWRAVSDFIPDSDCPSLTTLGVRDRYWNTWAVALEVHPADIPNLVLAIDVYCFNRYDDDEKAEEITLLPTLQCPTLVSVSLECPFCDTLAYCKLERAVLLAAGGAISTAQPSADICVCKVLDKLQECRSCAVALLKHALARQQRARGSGTVWKMCAHDAPGIV